MEGFVVSSILKDDAVGVKTGGLLGERGPLPAERGRETFRAAGGDFLTPLSIDLLGGVVAIEGSGGGDSSTASWRLLNNAGLGKLGLGNV